ALPQRDVDLAVRLGRKRDDAGAPFELPFREPLGDALKARPPEGARFRKVLQRGKVRCAERDQLTCWIRWQGSRKLCRALADGGVNDVAALSRAGLGVDGVKRPQPQNVFGIDR